MQDAQKVDVKDRGECDFTPLHWAARSNTDCEIITVLIKNGADAYAKDKNGRNPLYWLSQRKPGKPYIDILYYLIINKLIRNRANIS